MDTQIEVFGTQNDVLLREENSSGEGICDLDLKYKHLEYRT